MTKDEKRRMLQAANLRAAAPVLNTNKHSAAKKRKLDPKRLEARKPQFPQSLIRSLVSRNKTFEPLREEFATGKRNMCCGRLGNAELKDFYIFTMFNYEARYELKKLNYKELRLVFDGYYHFFTL